MKQVNTCSIQVFRGTMQWGPMLGTLVLRVEHPNIVRKLVKSLDMGEPVFHAKKNACCRLQQQTKVHVLALVWHTTLKTAHKALNKGRSAPNQTIPLSITSSEC